MVLNIEFVQVKVQENLASQMLRDAFVMLFQKVNDLKLCLLVWNQFKDFADKEVKNEFRVVLLVDVNDILLGKVDQLMSCEPVPSVPDTFHELFNCILIVNGCNVFDKQVSLPFVGLYVVPYAFVKCDLFIGLKLSFGFGNMGQDFWDMLE